MTHVGVRASDRSSPPGVNVSVANYRNADLWKQSVRLVLHSYTVTSTFPPDEPTDLAGKIRRAAVTTAVNVAAAFECACRDGGMIGHLTGPDSCMGIVALLPDGMSASELSACEVGALEDLCAAMDEMMEHLERDVFGPREPRLVT